MYHKDKQHYITDCECIEILVPKNKFQDFQEEVEVIANKHNATVSFTKVIDPNAPLVLTILETKDIQTKIDLELLILTYDFQKHTTDTNDCTMLH